MARGRETKESLRRRLEAAEEILQDVADLLADAGFPPSEEEEESEDEEETPETDE